MTKNNKELETPKDMGRGMLEWQLEKNIQQVKKNLKDKKERIQKQKMQNIKKENLPVEKG